jgi:hypothetical protein
MKKQYICPNMCVVKLLTSKSLLTVSGGDSGDMKIYDEEVSTTNSVWTKQSVWDDEW